MAFSKTPTADTYSSQPVPVIHTLDLKPGDTSFTTPYAGTTNVLPFKAGDTIVGETRAALDGGLVKSSANTQFIRGAYAWITGTATYWFVLIGTTTSGGNNLVYSSPGNGIWTLVNTIPATAAAMALVGFVEFIDATNVKKLILLEGVEGYVFTSNAAGTKIVDADFPTPHIVYGVFLNGRLYVAKTNTGDIYNSNLNDPALWTAGDFISSEVYPDDVKALVKINNYLLAVGSRGCEYFYDAANATGSPLARQEGATLPFGTSMPNLIASNFDTAVILADDNDGQSFFRIIQGFNYEDIPNADVIIRTLYTEIAAHNTTSVRVKGMLFRQNGELFYLVQFDVRTNPSPYPSFVYSFKNKLWSRFSFNGATETFPVFATSFGTDSLSGSATFWAGHYNNSIYFGKLSETSDTDLLNGTTYSIYQALYIPPMAFGTINRKFMHRFALNYVRATDNLADVPQVSYSDDLMVTFSTARSLVEPATGGTSGSGFPVITQLGQFRQRGFKITSVSYRTRWISAEADINKGQQ